MTALNNDSEKNTILELQGICKEFPGVRALDGVQFNLRAGEVHALLGENGAGKSTLVKIISGAYRKDAGTMFFLGKDVEIQSTSQARKMGISMVYQDFTLIPFLSVAENIFLGRQPQRKSLPFIIDKQVMYQKAATLIASFEMTIDPRVTVKDLGVAEKQMIEIAKSIAFQAKVLILDEPTATLSAKETEKLFSIIKRFKENGIGIIYISHRLEEIFAIADRITVMRNGKYITTKNIDEVSTPELIELMIGRKVPGTGTKKPIQSTTEVLRLENLCGEKFKNVNMQIMQGEIVGLAGLVGSGRTEILRTIFGADRIRKGSLIFHGKHLKIKSPEHAVRYGIALLPEDRKKDGLILCRSVEDNIIISSLKFFIKFGILNKGNISRNVSYFIEALHVKAQHKKQEVKNLSGGNQQKVVVAKWLCAKSDLILVDEPTHGIDVGAKQEVHDLIRDLAKEGKTILVVSSEIPELMSLCDRIYVMHEGEQVAEFPENEFNSAKILDAAFGTANAH